MKYKSDKGGMAKNFAYNQPKTSLTVDWIQFII